MTEPFKDLGGWTRIPNVILRGYGYLTPVQGVVFNTLLSWVDWRDPSEGFCVSRQQVADQTGLNVRTVQRTVGWLKSEGLVSEIPEPGHKSTWYLNIDQIVRKFQRAEGCHKVTTRGDTESPPGVTESHHPTSPLWGDVQERTEERNHEVSGVPPDGRDTEMDYGRDPDHIPQPPGRKSRSRDTQYGGDTESQPKQKKQKSPAALVCQHFEERWVGVKYLHPEYAFYNVIEAGAFHGWLNRKFFDVEPMWPVDVVNAMVDGFMDAVAHENILLIVEVPVWKVFARNFSRFQTHQAPVAPVQRSTTGKIQWPTNRHQRSS